MASALTNPMPARFLEELDESISSLSELGISSKSSNMHYSSMSSKSDELVMDAAGPQPLDPMEPASEEMEELDAKMPAKPVPTSNWIEISPGVTAKLRGANETIRAVRENFFTKVTCWECDQAIFCILDCRWTICPNCRFVSPLEYEKDSGSGAGYSHGLGLGLTRKTLWSMQQDASHIG